MQLADTHSPLDAVTTWLDELTTYTSTTRGVTTALMADPEGGIAVEDSCHGLLHGAAARLVADAAEAGVLRDEVTPLDLITLANALSLASDGDADAARRLLHLALGGVLSRTGAG
ncbi:hypothetical protein [Streptomyces xiamenensis]|uniref:SbtR family transcriptional regulator n=1 Tax=Streptomyces xiamenensis TaxID=408015 RepID=UPI003D7109A3